MIAVHVATWLSTLLSLGLGQSIFWDACPDGKTAPNVIAVWDCPTYDLPASSCLSLDNMGVQIEFRHKTANSAKSWAETVHKAIVGFSGYLCDGSPMIDTVQIDTQPRSESPDKDGLHCFIARYRFLVESSGDTYRL